MGKDPPFPRQIEDPGTLPALLKADTRVEYDGSLHPSTLTMSPARFSGFSILFPLFLVAVTSDCWARPLNVTVDDTYGDPKTGQLPRYSGSWARGIVPTAGSVLPDMAQIFNATLHQGGGREDGTVSLTFQGTDVYIFVVRDLSQPVELQFYLDDSPGPVAQYSRSAAQPGSSGYAYNQLVFNATGLRYSTHIVRVHVAASYVAWFDYMVYTMDKNKPIEVAEEESASPAGPSIIATCCAPSISGPESPDRPSGLRAERVVALAVASLLGGTLLGAALFLVRRRLRVRARDSHARAVGSARIGRTAAVTLVPLAVSPAEPISESDTVSPTGPAQLENRPKNVMRAPELDDAPAEDARPSRSSRGESMALMRAELERMYAENERARAENERVRGENELLRRVAVPPPYSDGGSDSMEDLLSA